jgi:lysophospholipase L1-like esterase
VYLRFAALGDSATVGLGDPVPGGWRGWSRLLASALATSYDVSYCNLAVSGATAGDVLGGQLAEAVAHRPDLASLVVGVNDTLRAGFDPERLRATLLTCAGALDAAGATLLTVRFHEHGAVLGLPGVLARPLHARLAVVNEVYDEVVATYGGVRVDLSLRPDVVDRACWSVDRLHPSERGHRALAAAAAEGLRAAGYDVEPPSDELDGLPVRWRDDAAWVVRAGVPWLGRRARDWGPVLIPRPAPRRRGPARR